jgi:GntR family transcriptional regulator, phosphonate transport system regulatory protein
VIVGREGDERMTVVERGEGVAAWRQIANQLEADISFGRLSPGSRLPIETDLAARFAVNRHTVRRALAELASRGLIRATAGRGTFVAGRPLAYPIAARTRFSEIVSSAGREAGGRLLAAAEAIADARVGEALQIAAGAAVMVLETLRSADGVPISMGTGYFPLPRFAGIANGYISQGSITRALALCGVADYLRAETRVSARAATSDEAGHLNLRPGRIVLTVDSINVDAGGLPVQFTRAVFAAERTELVVKS